MSIETVEAASHPRRASASPGAEAWRRLRRNPIAVISGVVVFALIFVALFAPWIVPYAYDAPDRPMAIPLAHPGGKHLLGTDNLGLDTFSRVVYGARVSLAVGVVVELIEVLIGVSLGLLAAYKGGIWDTVLMRITDGMFAFPDILFAILLVGIFQPTDPRASFLTVFVALALVGWPGMARLVRGQALALREKEYVEAARAIGVSGWGITTRHLLPNMLSPIIVAITVDIAAIIMAEATLSFLGIGIQPPYPSWGRMISDSRQYMRSEPMLILYPSLALAVTVLAFNFFGDALRDALDPRLRE
jgi:ABC-type dipeptide/oligopeptide/nickel transport system permease subunit